jgi:predicted Abi (CAAX) family protease
MVHCNTYAVPAVPVKVDVGEVAFAKDPPAPLTIVQRPVPMTGVFAARVTVVSPQVAAPVWLAPATDTVGPRLKVTFTVLDDAAQGAFEMVHCNT